MSLICKIWYEKKSSLLHFDILQMTVPFHLLWLNEFSRETATFIFFAMTGYKFRPTIANPYFQVASDVDDDDTDIV